MFFPAAKIIIRHPTDKNKILLVKRTIEDRIYYEPAGGRIEIDYQSKVAETLEACAIREVHEELGLIINLERYIGSYYFFWSTDINKGCSCAVFLGSIKEKDTNHMGNKDTDEHPIEPIWVTFDDILQKRISISAEHCGLESLIMHYIKEVML